MSLEQEIIARNAPRMLASRMQDIFMAEAVKGCRPDIVREPVALEPPFQPLHANAELDPRSQHALAVTETPPRPEEIVRLQIWISPEIAFKWSRSELFLKQLLDLSQRIGIEVIGNQDGIDLAFLCHRNDAPLVTAAFRGVFTHCRLSEQEKPRIYALPLEAWAKALFHDYFPRPPYSHLLTQPNELRASPYESLLANLSAIPSVYVGIYQTLFQPAPHGHNWKQNVQKLWDLEFRDKLSTPPQPAVRYLQQTPSGHLPEMAEDVMTKAHNDKPLYFMALRLAVIGHGTAGEDILTSISTVPHLFQHGGHSLRHRTHADYAPFLSPEQVRQMFLLGLTYRPGFIVNSWELTGPVHIPPPELIDERRLPLNLLNSLPVRTTELSKGSYIGECEYGVERMPVHIPPQVRSCHVHPLGRTNMGKSTLLEHMIIEDILNGIGVAVLDPHGDLAKRLLTLIPKEHVDRVIYFDPGNPDWIPLWNPIRTLAGHKPGQTADEMVGALRRVTSGWGDRLATLLGHAIFAVAQMPNGTFQTVSNILREKSGGELREQALQILTNENARNFWQYEFPRYRKDDLTPPQHKLSKLLLGDEVPLMLSQPENRIDFRKIMDQGMIFIADLSTAGSDQADLLGGFQLSLFHLTALGRSDTPIEARKPFHIYCDEAHRLVSDSIESLIDEMRKFGVSLTLAHVHLKQFDREKRNALANMGTTIIFNVDSEDAGHLAKNLFGLATVEDLITLEQGEAIARIGNQVVRIKTPKPLPVLENNCRQQIIDASHRKYYRPARELRRGVFNDNRHASRRFLSYGTEPDQAGKPEEFSYDEFGINPQG